MGSTTTTMVTSTMSTAMTSTMTTVTRATTTIMGRMLRERSARKATTALALPGVNWNVQIMALKFLGADGSGTTSDAIEAIRYAVDNGAHISNNSWGGDPYSQALFDVIEDARDANHIFVAAAGNGNWIGFGIDNDAQPFYPASYRSRQHRRRRGNGSQRSKSNLLELRPHERRRRCAGRQHSQHDKEWDLRDIQRDIDGNTSCRGCD